MIFVSIEILTREQPKINLGSQEQSGSFRGELERGARDPPYRGSTFISTKGRGVRISIILFIVETKIV